ncbi:lectin-like domain-containing protein, partial [Enterococcus faecalis]
MSKYNRKTLTFLTIVSMIGNIFLPAVTASSQTVTGSVIELNGPIKVNKDNFLDYFALHGDASYDGTDGIVTITPDEKEKSGNFSLKSKISMSSSFILKGKINLGNKTKEKGGADGIGFAFHPGNPSIVGLSGNALGIGGLQDGFGFKLDTFYNPVDEPARKALKDPSQFDNKSFGAYVTTNEKTEAVTYDQADAPAREISNPSNNEFKPIEFAYDGEMKNMTIKYDGKTWSRNIEDWLKDNTAMSFSVTASTGWMHNLQQFLIEDFEYTPVRGSVQLTKEDEETGEALEGAVFELQDKDGNVLLSDLVTNEEGQITITEIDAGDYQLVEVKAPAGYELDSQPIFFTVNENDNQLITITKTNKVVLGEAILTKTDKKTGEALQGAVFELQDKDGKVLQSGLTTDDSGKLALEGLEPGEYQLVETKAPVGYDLDETPVSFTIEKGQKAAVEVSMT